MRRIWRHRLPPAAANACRWSDGRVGQGSHAENAEIAEARVGRGKYAHRSPPAAANARGVVRWSGRSRISRGERGDRGGWCMPPKWRPPIAACGGECAPGGPMVGSISRISRGERGDRGGWCMLRVWRPPTAACGGECAQGGWNRTPRTYPLGARFHPPCAHQPGEAGRSVGAQASASSAVSACKSLRANCGE
jgi:hypothetical protein